MSVVAIKVNSGYILAGLICAFVLTNIAFEYSYGNIRGEVCQFISTH